MNIPAIYTKLCDPAKFYFVISIICFIILLLQNVGIHGKFNLGLYSVEHKETPLILVGNFLYIILWTWILNFICKFNPQISWVIVLFPFILTFVILGYILFLSLMNKSKEPFRKKDPFFDGHETGKEKNIPPFIV